MDKTLHASKIKTFLITLLLLVLGSFSGFSQTNTFTGPVFSNWNNASNWSAGVPTAAQDVVIPIGKSVTVNADALAKTISLTGSLAMNNNVKLIVYGNFTVNAFGNFAMPTGNGLATLIVYGNYINNGSSDFWKSNVIILGDLLSPSSSALQNQGNIVVGGNIIGDFSLSGGTGANQIYSLNPNATVTITPTSIDNNIIPGTPIPGSEGSALIDLVNQVMYGGSCPFVVSDVVDVTTCAGNNAVFTVTTSGSSPSYQWQVNNSGSGWSNLANDAVYSGVTTSILTISNASIAMDGYRYRANITAGSCSKSGNYGKLLFTPGPAAPIVGAVIQPTCAVATGSVVLSGLPLSGIVNPGNISYAGTSCTISDLSPGTYAFTVSNATCASSPSTNVVITPTATTTWNGSSWSNGLPAIGKNVVFSGNYSSTANFDACSCTVNPGVNVTVNSGHTLTVSNAITATSGSLIFENNASLIQSGYNGANTGNVIVKRNSAPLILGDYTYWSSPTTGSQTLLNFSPNTPASNFFTYHNSWAYANAGADTFTKGLGYAIIAPVGTSATVPTSLAHQFTGVPNNGNIDVAVSLGPNLISNRLIGNPYPSAIDADAFINANVIGVGSINRTISGTLYFWTHNHSLIGNNYLSSDYAVYNLTGGTAVASGTGNTGVPTRYIPSGQGFFVHTVASGNVSFRNTMRSGTSNTNFYKTANSTTAVPTLESHRMWLNLTNSTSSFSQMLLGYIETATDEVNPGLDGLFYGSDRHVLYSLIGTEAYAIQAKALPFVTTDSVPLGYKISVAGSTTISLDHVDGLFSGGQNIYLVDQLLGVTHDLKATPYTFTSQAGTFNDRFILRYTTESLGSGGFDIQNKVTVATGKNCIIIKSESETIDQVILFDMFGRKIHEKSRINNNEFQISDVMTHQTLIAQIILANGQVIAKKLVY